MTTNFDWRGAFDNTGIDCTREQRNQVIQAIADWNSDWEIDNHDLYITRIEDEDGDGIWDADYDDSDDVDQYFSSEFIEWMDTKFMGKKRSKKPVVIGKSTKLPIPGARP
jgi:hypothetical protein